MYNSVIRQLLRVCLLVINAFCCHSGLAHIMELHISFFLIVLFSLKHSYYTQGLRSGLVLCTVFTGKCTRCKNKDKGVKAVRLVR